ncbi:hypothetical protein BDZ91DRAFT_712428 [Kalaharituber pfeilii]|nr:hypothetical protein BDZ91DRAFT_712428 [Kalaharituber pfeilii]
MSFCVSRYSTTELVCFPSSASIVFFLNHLIPLVLPNSSFDVSSHFLTLSKSFLKAMPCTTMP